MSHASTYDSTESNPIEAAEKEKTGWKLFAIWTLIVVVVNLLLAFIVGANQFEFKTIGSLSSYLVGNVLGLPIIVLLVSQAWKKYRSGRQRVKAVLYTSYLVLFSQFGSFFNMVSDVAENLN